MLAIGGVCNLFLKADCAPAHSGGRVRVCVYTREKLYKNLQFSRKAYFKGSWSGPKLYGPVRQHHLTDELVLV